MVDPCLKAQWRQSIYTYEITGRKDSGEQEFSSATLRDCVKIHQEWTIRNTEDGDAQEFLDITIWADFELRRGTRVILTPDETQNLADFYIVRTIKKYFDENGAIDFYEYGLGVTL